MKTRPEAALYKPRTAASGETQPAGPGSYTSGLQNCEKINVCHFSPGVVLRPGRPGTQPPSGVRGASLCRTEDGSITRTYHIAVTHPSARDAWGASGGALVDLYFTSCPNNSRLPPQMAQKGQERKGHWRLQSTYCVSPSWLGVLDKFMG